MEKYEKPTIEVINLIFEQMLLNGSTPSIGIDEDENVDEDKR